MKTMMVLFFFMVSLVQIFANDGKGLFDLRPKDQVLFKSKMLGASKLRYESMHGERAQLHNDTVLTVCSVSDVKNPYDSIVHCDLIHEIQFSVNQCQDDPSDWLMMTQCNPPVSEKFLLLEKLGMILQQI